MADKLPPKYVPVRAYVDPGKLRRFKAKLALVGLSISEWLRREIDKVLDE